jgi:hypothetical protein
VGYPDRGGKVGDCLSHGPGDHLRVDRGGLRKEHRELFSTIARNQIGRPFESRREGLGHPPDALVAVAIGVVEGFELIDVDEQHRKRGFRTLAPFEFAVECSVEPSPVRHGG